MDGKLRFYVLCTSVESGSILELGSDSISKVVSV